MRANKRIYQLCSALPQLRRGSAIAPRSKSQVTGQVSQSATRLPTALEMLFVLQERLSCKART